MARKHHLDHILSAAAISGPVLRFFFPWDIEGEPIFSDLDKCILYLVLDGENIGRRMLRLKLPGRMTRFQDAVKEDVKLVGEGR